MESGDSGVPGRRLRCEDTGDSEDQGTGDSGPCLFHLSLVAAQVVYASGALSGGWPEYARRLLKVSGPSGVSGILVGRSFCPGRILRGLRPESPG